MRKKVLLLLYFLILVAIAFTSISCEQEEKGDTRCYYIIDGSEEDIEGCVPELPENVDPGIISAYLDAHLGTYVDGNGAQRVITCRPEGIWKIPNPDSVASCVYNWDIPIWITFSEDGTTIEGYFNQFGYEPQDMTDPTTWPADAGLFLFDIYNDSEDCPLGVCPSAEKHWTPEKILQWIFTYPEEWEGVVWTKVD